MLPIPGGETKTDGIAAARFLFPALGQCVSLSVGAPLVDGLGLLRGGEVEYLAELRQHPANVGGLEAAPLHCGNDVAPAGPLAPRLGE